MIDIRDEEIKAIKVLREFCHETFGVASGLKQSKDFVEDLISLQQDHFRRVSDLKLKADSLRGYSVDDLNEIFKDRGLTVTGNYF